MLVFKHDTEEVGGGVCWLTYITRATEQKSIWALRPTHGDTGVAVGTTLTLHNGLDTG